MALVAFLKGINVGGHRSFRPSVLAKTLQRFDVVNVGAAGTFVVRKPVSRTKLRAKILRRLPFEAEVMICGGSEIMRLVAAQPFAGQPAASNIIWFVSVLARRRAPLSPLPLSLPSAKDWCVHVITIRNQFVLGLYRREMRTIGYLGRLEKLLRAPVATRNWNTILTISRILSHA